MSNRGVKIIPLSKLGFANGGFEEEERAFSSERNA